MVNKKLIIGAVVIIAVILFLTSPSGSPVQKEVNRYKGMSGYTIDNSEAWSSFKTLGGVFSEVSQSRLRIEAQKVHDELGFCRIFVDENADVIWISGIGLDELERYIYSWSP